MLFDQLFKTLPLVDAAVDVLAARSFLCDAGHSLTFGLFHNALVNNRDLVRVQCAVNFAVAPVQHIRAQPLDIFCGNR